MDLDETIENLSEELELSGISKRQNESAVPSPEVPAPSQAEVEEFYSKLSKCNSKTCCAEFGPPYAQTYVLPSRNISTNKPRNNIIYPRNITAWPRFLP